MAITMRKGKVGKVLPKPHYMVKTQVEDIASKYEMVVDDIRADENSFKSAKPERIDNQEINI